MHGSCGRSAPEVNMSDTGEGEREGERACVCVKEKEERKRDTQRQKGRANSILKQSIYRSGLTRFGGVPGRA